VPSPANQISSALGVAIRNVHELSGGCISRVMAGNAGEYGEIVAKLGDSVGDLTIEAEMLEDLARLTQLPVPRVLHSAKSLLVMERLPGSPGASQAAQRHLAELVAELHGVGGSSYGYVRDTLIGPLPQPNPAMDRWATFFAQHRLIHFAQMAHDRRTLPAGGLEHAHRLAEAIEQRPENFVAEGQPSVLIHGDLWSGNILSDGDRITGLIDPAIYYADREIELAFMDLFGGVGPAFFERYHELRPIAGGFFERRRAMYQIYPLLVHAVLFGGGYGARAVDAMRRTMANA